MPEVSGNVRNHCVPILDYFFVEREDDDVTHYIVMPVLRNLDDPPFYAVAEVFEFVRQTLEVGNSFSKCWNGKG